MQGFLLLKIRSSENDAEKNRPNENENNFPIFVSWMIT